MKAVGEVEAEGDGHDECDDDVSGVHDAVSVIRTVAAANPRSPTFHDPVKGR